MKRTILYLSKASERLKALSCVSSSGIDDLEERRKRYKAEQKAFTEISTKEFKRLFGIEFNIDKDYDELFL